MLRNMEINGLMTAISLKLSCPSYEPNHELWSIYDSLQAWKMNIEWDEPGIGRDSTLESAAIVLDKLKALPDRTLAAEIESIVHKNTALADERRHKNPAWLLKQKTSYASASVA